MIIYRCRGKDIPQGGIQTMKIVNDNKKYYNIFRERTNREIKTILVIAIGDDVFYDRLREDFPNAEIYSIDEEYVDSQNVIFDGLNIKSLLKISDAKIKESDNLKNIEKAIGNCAMKFDCVIMNPPYDIGGKIWDEVRKVSEDVVCLMPLAQYKANERYKYINYFEVVNNTLFDATISGNLCITTCQSKDNGKNYEDFLFDSFNQNYRAFYEWNKLYLRERNIRLKVESYKPYTDFDIDLDFAIGNRVVKQSHCISITGKGFDYYWNVLRRDYEDNWVSEVSIIHFNSKEARDNFTTFIYSKEGEPFMSKVIRGLNLIKVSSLVSFAIPQIDWEKISDHPLWKEGKYDEAVLDTMGLKWEGEKIVEVR